MKQQRFLIGFMGLVLFLALWGGWNSPAHSDVKAQSAGEAWTIELRPLDVTSNGGYLYQGLMELGGTPADGSFDFQFRLYPTAGNGAPFGTTISFEDLVVSAGAFTVALDWGQPALNAGRFWIEVGVRAGNSSTSDPFTVLSQRVRQDGTGSGTESATPAPAAQPQQQGSPQQQHTPPQPSAPQQPRVPGDFTLKASSPVPLTSVTSDPYTGLVYAQANNGTDFYVYDPVADTWSSLAPSPLYSGNNGGAAYVTGKIYTVYTENNTDMGVYDIASNTWSTVPNPLGIGTGVIATDGRYLYLAAGATFKGYDPNYNYWWDLPAPSIDIQPWGGMAFWNGKLYVHRGNGYTEFAKYDTWWGSWTTLAPVPGGAVLGSAIDPVGPVYYAYGSYDGTNWYAFDLEYEIWYGILTTPFAVVDGGMAYVSQGDVGGIYFVQGEENTGFARLETVPPQVGDFSLKPYSPAPLTSVTADPNTGFIYAQQNQGTAFYLYDPLPDIWKQLPDSPLFSGNNGGAAYLGGKIYTVYSEDWTNMGIYDIASSSWSTMPNGLGAGTGVIASDGTYLYLAVGSIFKRYDPVGNAWTDLATSPIYFQAWGGMAYWNGKLYGHTGNGTVEFARYDIASNAWTTLASLPDGAVLGGAIDPVRHRYYTYGTYWGTNWYIFNLDTETWSVESIPFFTVDDGGMVYTTRGHASGVYFVQGESRIGFGRYQDATPSTGGFTINNGAAYVNTTSVTLNVSAADPETGVSNMRFRNTSPWKMLLFQDYLPWGSDAMVQVAVKGNALHGDVLTSADMATVDLAPYSQVFIPSVQGSTFYSNFDASLSKFEDFIDGGGSMFMSFATQGESVSIPFGGTNPFIGASSNYIVDPSHPIFAGVANPYWGSAASHNTISGLLPEDDVLVTAGDIPGGDPVMIERRAGSGLLVAGGQTFEAAWAWSWEGAKILENTIAYVAGQKPWAASYAWTLPAGDGVKTVYGQFRNGGGVWSDVLNDTITLDTKAPTAAASCVANAQKNSFPVNWSGSDTLSGIANYDVQYRVGTGGAWTNWPGLIGTTKTTATFGPNSPIVVGYDETYYFRVRAHDKAGNVSAYASAGDCSTYVELAYIRLPIVLNNYSIFAAPCSSSNNWCEDFDSWENAYGPLGFGQGYQAYPEDTVDYYYFNVASTSSVTIIVTNFQATGQLVLYRHREGNTPELVQSYGGGGSTMTIGPLSLTANKYYVQVVADTYKPSILYTLTVTGD